MKYIYLPIFLFCLATHAQSIKVTYAEKQIISQQRLEAMPPSVKNAQLAEMQIPKLFTLEYTEGISIYQKDKNTKDFKYEKKDSNINSDGISEESSIVVNKKNTPFFYYKELNNNLMLFKLSNIGIDFDGKDRLILWNWEVTNETKIINGYNCKKAISRTFDAYFTVWFTEDIPVTAGPEKFDGLPGLILYVNTGAVEFIAEKVEILKEKIAITKPQIPSSTVTFAEMVDIVTKKFSQVKSSKPVKQGNTTITTETY